MNDLALKIYHRLPSPARSLIASLRGRQLLSWRYGPESERLIEEALERESWNAATWMNWQEETLVRMLHHAATRVPWYRRLWTERRIHGDRRSIEKIENWPVLDKEAVRADPLAFVADDSDIRRMYREQTSGTTGKPISQWWTRESVRAWFALYELRIRRWHGVSRHEPWAILGGQPVVPAHVSRPPFWVWNAPMNQLYLSANHISARNLEAFLGAIDRYHVTHLITYSSSAAQFARETIDAGRQVEGISVVITNAEPLYPWQREVIHHGWGCEARETYGMAEIVTAASECPQGSLHLWPEVGLTEIVQDDDDTPQTEGESGRLICTSLLNTGMPLIRYNVGDRARMKASETGCPCGRNLPLISAIEGRSNDLLRTRDGRSIYWVNPIFYGLALSEAQIVQESVDLVRILYVPARGLDPQAESIMCDRLRSRMGEIDIRFERVTSIPKSANGKFRAVVSNIP